MPLTRAEQPRAPVAEGDPLPPDDRLPIERTPTVEQVYRVERPRLLRFLARRASAEAADDLVQQTFEQLLSRQSENAPRIWRLDSYLFRVARNVATDQIRADQRRARDDHFPLDDLESAAPELVPSADQVAALEARDMLHRLEVVMQRMKPRTREIFLAHRIDGYTYGEIAARTGLSVKGVEKHMSRAIATIDRSMSAK